MGNKLNKKDLEKVHLDPSLESKLHSIFDRFDINGDGTVEMDEILEKFENNPTEGGQVKKLFEQMDEDSSGGTDREEFILFWKSIKQKGRTSEDLERQLDKLFDIVKRQDEKNDKAALERK